MRKEVQEVLESAIAGFEKRQQAKQERLREQEWFETGWAQIRTAVVLPALEEVAVLRAALTSNVMAVLHRLLDARRTVGSRFAPNKHTVQNEAVENRAVFV